MFYIKIKQKGNNIDDFFAKNKNKLYLCIRRDNSNCIDCNFGISSTELLIIRNGLW
jgi:hypothetical protein